MEKRDIIIPLNYFLLNNNLSSVSSSVKKKKNLQYNATVQHLSK